MDMTKVWQYIDDHREEYVSLLKKFVNQPSVSATGQGIREMANLVCDTQKWLGAPSEVVECLKHPIVAGKIDNGAERTLMIYNHYDVMPVEPLEQWNTPPFEATEKDGKLFGRGVADNKGSLLSRYCAIDAYQKVYGKLPINIQFLAEGSEEIGSPGLPEFIAANPDKTKADGIIWEGGSRNINHGPLQVTFGLKGICYVELRCRGAKNDIHSSYASIIESPAWRLVWALNTLKNDKEEITIDGFNELVIPPNEDDYRNLENMIYDEQATLESFGVDKFLLDLKGMDLKLKYLYKPALNICGIECGYTGEGSKTVLPNYAAAKLDFRLVLGQRPPQVLELLRKHLDKHGFEDIEIVNYNNTIPYRGGMDTLIGKAILQNVERVYGMPPVVYTSTAGSSGMGYFCELTGIPAVCIGVYNDDSQCHAPNEYIFVEDFIKGIKLSTCVLHDFADVE